MDKKKCYENDVNLQGFQKLYNSRNNLIDILDELGYDINSYKNFSSVELSHMISYEQLDMIVTNNNTGIKIYVKYFEYGQNKVLNKVAIDNMIEDLYKIEKLLSKDDILFIIHHCDPNDSCKTHLKHIWETDKYLISVIDIKRLGFNILKHEHVSKHIILNEEEDIEFRNKFNIKDELSIPQISRFDPVAQLIAMKPGNICKINRSSKTAINSEYFRICMNK
tara:strand:+ start:2153 stop:2818 length:666 start_codon:yes stop_codon:yes gene_type:complete